MSYAGKQLSLQKHTQNKDLETEVSHMCYTEIMVEPVRVNKSTRRDPKGETKGKENKCRIKKTTQGSLESLECVSEKHGDCGKF